MEVWRYFLPLTTGQETRQNQGLLSCNKRDRIPFNVRLGSEDGKDTGIWMIIGNGANSVVKLQVILARGIVSSPPDNIKGWIWTVGLKKFPHVLIYHQPLLILILEPSCGVLEIFWVGQSVCTNRSKLREWEVMSVAFSDPPTNLTLHLHTEFNSSRDDEDLFWPHHHLPTQGFHIQCSSVWNNQEVPIRVIEALVVHGCVGGVNIDG